MAVPVQSGNRPTDAKAMAGTQVMMNWSGVKQLFLLSPQSSALITSLLSLNPER